MNYGKTAVVLFNLGGPDRLESVEPFLFNFFRDPAIIGAPGFIRYLLALYISKTRSKLSKENYKIIGGKTTLVEETEKQRQALESLLQKEIGDVNVYFIMRYWHPRAKQVIENLDSDYKNIILIPLYPQYSTTTTASSFKEWEKYYKGKAKVKAICCYPDQVDFINSHSQLIVDKWQNSGKNENLRVLFSAHGIPRNLIDKGDPYQYQIEQTAEKIAENLPEALSDWQVCYQSKVGPLEWTGPSLDEALNQAKKDHKGVIISPIAFVSEHVETLVELDYEYAEIADELKIKPYLRTPTLSLDKLYIKALKEITLKALKSKKLYPSLARSRYCPNNWKKCPHKIKEK